MRARLLPLVGILTAAALMASFVAGFWDGPL